MSQAGAEELDTSFTMTLNTEQLLVGCTLAVHPVSPTDRLEPASG